MGVGGAARPPRPAQDLKSKTPGTAEHKATNPTIM